MRENSRFRDEQRHIHVRLLQSTKLTEFTKLYSMIIVLASVRIRRYYTCRFSGGRFAFASREMDVAGKRRVREIHIGIGRVVVRRSVVGNLFVGQTTVLRVFERRGKKTMKKKTNGFSCTETTPGWPLTR